MISIPVKARVILAFFAIYVLWGATFLAIRVAVLEVPPFLMAGLRFFLAGSLLYGFMRLRGEPSPSPAQWRSIGLMALFMFVITYGALFWAMQYVPSGVTSVIEATLPITTLTLEVAVFRQQPFRWGMLGSVAAGFVGVALLLIGNGEKAVALMPCLVILAAGVAWSLGAVLTRSMPLPRSRSVTAGGAMMLGGLAAARALACIGGNQSVTVHSSTSCHRAAVLDRRRFVDRIYGVRLAVGANAGDARREPRVREPRCGSWRSAISSRARN